jgi:hypothetical protein
VSEMVPDRLKPVQTIAQMLACRWSDSANGHAPSGDEKERMGVTLWSILVSVNIYYINYHAAEDERLFCFEGLDGDLSVEASNREL